MKLFGSTNKKSFNTMKIRAALAEADAAYEFVPVDIPKGEHKTVDFLAMNPHGKIPVLLDEKFALAESDAILWYVAEKYPAAKLLPPPDRALPATQARALVLQWCDFASTGLYAAYVEWWVMGHGTDPQKRVAAIADGAVAKVERAVAVMQAVLGTREYLAGPFSIADYSNAAVLQTLKLRLPEDPLVKYDRVQAWYARVTGRPAWTQAIAE